MWAGLPIQRYDHSRSRNQQRFHRWGNLQRFKDNLTILVSHLRTIWTWQWLRRCAERCENRLGINGNSASLLGQIYRLLMTSWRPCWWTGAIRFFSSDSSLLFLCKLCEQIFFCFVHEHGGSENHLYLSRRDSEDSFNISRVWFRISVVLKKIRSTYPILWEEGNPWPDVCWLRTSLRIQLELLVIEVKTICFEKICIFIHNILITRCEK